MEAKDTDAPEFQNAAFNLETGAAENDAARNILIKAAQDAVASGSGSSSSSSNSSRSTRSTSSTSSSGAEHNILAAIPYCTIATGTWKYVQIALHVGVRSGVSKSSKSRSKGSGGSSKIVKYVVRSYEGLKFHAQMYEKAMQELRTMGVAGKVVGGGRIAMDPAQRSIHIYGYSKTFGRAEGCNEASSLIIQKSYPDWKVTWSDDGY